MRYKHSISFGIFLLLLVGGWLLLRFPTMVMPFTISLLCVVVAFSGMTIFRYVARKRDAFRYWIFFSIATVSGMLFFLFLEQRSAQIFFLIVLSVLPGIFINQVIRRIPEQDASKSAVPSFMLYASIVVFFFMSVVIFDARFFFAFPRGWLLALSAIGSCSVIFPLFSQQEHKSLLAWHVSACVLVYVELIAVLLLLPHIPLVKGIIATSAMYALYDTLLQGQALQKNPQRTLRTFLLTSVAIIISLLTARWM